MQWSANPYFEPLFIAGLIGVLNVLFISRRIKVTGALPLLVMVLAVSEWALAYAMEMALIKPFLNVSDQQLQDLTGVEATFREAARPLMRQMREKAQTMRQTLQQDPKADVSQLQADLASLRTQIKDLQTQYQAQAQRVLTEEQKANLATLQKALELMPTVHQAMGLNLLERPEGFAKGFGGTRFFRGRGPSAPPKQ